MMNLPKPIDLLPHRDPFLFVDEITALVPGKSVEAFWDLTGKEDFFAGHFPDRPTLPGVLMVESLAQVGACGVLSVPDFAEKLPLFGGVSNVKFRKQVVPGDRLELSVELTSLRSTAGKGTGKVLVDGAVACKAELLFAIVDA